MIRPTRLQAIRRPFWGVEEVCSVLGLTPEAARVYLSREYRRGAVLRVRRNLYVLPSVARRLSETDLFLLANQCQTPSYVSLCSALSYHGASSQIPQAMVESVSPTRPVQYAVGAVSLRYFFVRRERYFGFSRVDGVFIASAEKALLDALYLMRYGKYQLDEAALDPEKISPKALSAMLGSYPAAFVAFFKDWRKSHGCA